MPTASQDILSQAMSFAVDVLADPAPRPFRAAFFLDMPQGEMAIVPLLSEVDRPTMLTSAREFVSSHRNERFALAVCSPPEGDVEQIHLTYVDGQNEPCHFLATMDRESGRRVIGPYAPTDEVSVEIAEVLGDLISTELGPTSG